MNHPEWSEQLGWISELEEFTIQPDVRIIEPTIRVALDHILVVLTSADEDFENHGERLRFLAAVTNYYAKAETMAAMVRQFPEVFPELEPSNPHYLKTIESLAEAGPNQRRPIVGTFLPTACDDDANIYLKYVCESFCRFYSPSIAMFTVDTPLQQAMAEAFPPGSRSTGPAAFYDWWCKLAKKRDLAAVKWAQYGLEGTVALAESGGMGQGFESAEQELAILNSVIPNSILNSPEWQRPDV